MLTVWKRPNASLLDDWFDSMLQSDRSKINIPQFETSEDDKAYFVRSLLPGCHPEDIQVEVANSLLHIKVEKSKEQKSTNKFTSEAYSLSQSWTLPQNASREVEAEFKNGVLLVTIKKVEPKSSEAKRIPIKG